MTYRVLIQPTAKGELREAYVGFMSNRPPLQPGGSTVYSTKYRRWKLILNVARLLRRTMPSKKPSVSFSTVRSTASIGFYSRFETSTLTRNGPVVLRKSDPVLDHD